MNKTQTAIIKAMKTGQTSASKIRRMVKDSGCRIGAVSFYKEMTKLVDAGTCEEFHLPLGENLKKPDGTNYMSIHFRLK